MRLHALCLTWKLRLVKETTRMRPQRGKKSKTEKRVGTLQSLQGKSHLRHLSRMRWLMSPQTRLKPFTSLSHKHTEEKKHCVISAPLSYEALFEWHFSHFFVFRLSPVHNKYYIGLRYRDNIQAKSLRLHIWNSKRETSWVTAKRFEGRS